MPACLPMQRIWERVDIARQDSDTALFLHLLYAGEMLTKLVTAGLVAAIGDDRERHRYRLLHRLARADGLGEWTQVLDDLLTGPASQYLIAEAREDQRELTQRFGSDSWQHDAVHQLSSVVQRIDPDVEDPPAKVGGRQWFQTFVMLRNKTRGHGAPSPALCNALCPGLDTTIRLVNDKLRLLHRPWAYLHRNLSGKYRVVALGGETACFDYLETSAHLRLGSADRPPDGVYIHIGSPRRVDLLITNVDVADFSFPNGSFNGRTFELLSYITDNRAEADATPYLVPAEELPPSETEGLEMLDVVGEVFTNLPPEQSDYIARSALETELSDVLVDDRHPVITLVGRGGIGKTWLALAVLHQIAQHDRFEGILWFSARDIDLLPQGPKVVTPRVLTKGDIAGELVDLIGPKEAGEKSFDPLSYFGEALTKSPFGGPMLFVFDNFETVRNSPDLFAWLDARIRSPNKILITTRHREFKADYPVVVSGMTEGEANELMTSVAARLGVGNILTPAYRDQVYRESAGHPYIIKVLLGEVAKANRLVKVERIVASKDELLDALFERTYARLSPVARRVFLTLCRWRSIVPQVALEAILLRPANESMDVQSGVEELTRSSFLENFQADDQTLFLSVPLVASVFGKRKLEVSPMKAAIEADVELLHVIGATQESGLRHGVRPRIERLFEHVANEVGRDQETLCEYLPILEFVCRQYAPAWLMLAGLYEEVRLPEALDKAKEAVRRLLERAEDPTLQRQGWEQMAGLCQRTQDWAGEIQALVGLCKLPDSLFSNISNAANRLNNLHRQRSLVLDSEEKRVIFNELTDLMEQRADEADATDLSRLAWLCLHLGDEDRARAHTERGLALDPYNAHCVNLAERLRLL